MKGHYLVMTCRRIKKNIWSRDRVSFLHFSGRGVGNTENKRTNRSGLLLCFLLPFHQVSEGESKVSKASFEQRNNRYTFRAFTCVWFFGNE